MMLLKEKTIFTKAECETILSYNNIDITDWEMPDRKYKSSPIIHSTETGWLFDKLKTFFETETGLQISTIKKQIHFHKYKKGDWFGKHNDIRDNRFYAVGVLLNDNFVGGDFIMYNTDMQILNKKIGNTYLFDVRIDHEIKPILDGSRYSLLWFLQQEHIKLKITKLI